MNLPLLHALNQLANETRVFLSDLDPEPDQWETYMSQRTVLLAELAEISSSAADLAEPVCAALKEEILQQEALVHERALTKLAGVGLKMQTLKQGRRALQGYQTSAMPLLFERNI